MTYERIVLEKEDKVAKIILNRPQIHNPLDYKTAVEIDTALSEIEQDTKIKVLIISGAGNALSAGADLKYLKSVRNQPEQIAQFIYKINKAFNHLEELSIPVIAVVKGYALAGGLELLLACDLCIAADDAIIGDQHSNFGLIPGGGGSQRLPRVIGTRKAKELLYTGKWLTGKEAEKWGLVNKAVPAVKLEETVREIVDQIAGKSTEGVSLLKFLVNQTKQLELSEGIKLETEVFLKYLNSKDVEEGLTAFEQKRTPVFD